MAESGKEIGRDNGHEGEVGRTHVEVEDSAAVRGAFRSHDGRPPLIERVAGLRRRLEKIEHIIFGHAMLARESPISAKKEEKKGARGKRRALR